MESHQSDSALELKIAERGPSLRFLVAFEDLEAQISLLFILNQTLMKFSFKKKQPYLVEFDVFRMFPFEKKGVIRTAQRNLLELQLERIPNRFHSNF